MTAWRLRQRPGPGEGVSRAETPGLGAAEAAGPPPRFAASPLRSPESLWSFTAPRRLWDPGGGLPRVPPQTWTPGLLSAEERRPGGSLTSTSASEPAPDPAVKGPPLPPRWLPGASPCPDFSQCPRRPPSAQPCPGLPCRGRARTRSTGPLKSGLRRRWPGPPPRHRRRRARAEVGAPRARPFPGSKGPAAAAAGAAGDRSEDGGETRGWVTSTGPVPGKPPRAAGVSSRCGNRRDDLSGAGPSTASTWGPSRLGVSPGETSVFSAREEAPSSQETLGSGGRGGHGGDFRPTDRGR